MPAKTNSKTIGAGIYLTAYRSGRLLPIEFKFFIGKNSSLLILFFAVRSDFLNIADILKKNNIDKRETYQRQQEEIDYGMNPQNILPDVSVDPMDDTLNDIENLFEVERDIEKMVREKLKELNDHKEITFYDNPSTEEEIEAQSKVKVKTQELIASAIVHYVKRPDTKYKFINQEHTEIIKKELLMK